MVGAQGDGAGYGVINPLDAGMPAPTAVGLSAAAVAALLCWVASVLACRRALRRATSPLLLNRRCVDGGKTARRACERLPHMPSRRASGDQVHAWGSPSEYGRSDCTPVEAVPASIVQGLGAAAEVAVVDVGMGVTAADGAAGHAAAPVARASGGLPLASALVATACESEYELTRAARK